MKDSFILYVDQKEIIDTLTDNEAGKLLKAIFEYETTQKLPKLSKTLNLVFIPIKNALDRNREKYEKACEKNKKNISKRWNKENTKNTSGKNGIQKDTKNTDNDNDSEHDNDSESDNDNEHDSVNDTKKENIKEKIEAFRKGFGTYDS